MNCEAFWYRTPKPPRRFPKPTLTRNAEFPHRPRLPALPPSPRLRRAGENPRSQRFLKVGAARSRAPRRYPRGISACLGSPTPSALRVLCDLKAWPLRSIRCSCGENHQRIENTAGRSAFLFALRPEIYSHSVGARLRSGFADLVHEASLSSGTGGVGIRTIVRRRRDHVSIAVNIDIG